MKDYRKCDDECVERLSEVEITEYARWLRNHPTHLKKFFRNTHKLVQQQIEAIENF